MKVTARALAEIHGVDRRTVTNWLNETPPCPSEITDGAREFDTVLVQRWMEERAVRRVLAVRDREQPDGKEARATRRAQLEDRLLELEVAREEGKVVTVETHIGVVAELADRLRATAINLPSTFGLDLERLGVAADVAEGFLEGVGQAFVRALRRRAAEVEALGDAELADDEPDDDAQLAGDEGADAGEAESADEVGADDGDPDPPPDGVT